MFYLGGKIIEIQGIPAISSEYGEHEYEPILERLGEYGFVVISEHRHKNTEANRYARKIVEKVSILLNVGVPAKIITNVRASKSVGNAIYVSHFLENEEINFVIMAIYMGMSFLSMMAVMFTQELAKNGFHTPRESVYRDMMKWFWKSAPATESFISRWMNGYCLPGIGLAIIPV